MRGAARKDSRFRPRREAPLPGELGEPTGTVQGKGNLGNQLGYLGNWGNGKKGANLGAERASEQASAAQSDVDYRRPGLARAHREGNSGGGAERLRVFLLRPHPPAQRTVGRSVRSSAQSGSSGLVRVFERIYFGQLEGSSGTFGTKKFIPREAKPAKKRTERSGVWSARAPARKDSRFRPRRQALEQLGRGREP